MKRQSSLIFKLSEFILARRWLVLVVGAGSVLSLELLGVWRNGGQFDAHFWQNIIVYGLLGPLLVWVLLSMLARELRATVPVAQIQAAATRAERKRIARNLHDKLAQDLSYLHFKLDQLAESLDDETDADAARLQTDLSQLRQVADQAVDEIRETLDSLRPQAISADTPGDALKQLVAGLQHNHGLKIDIADQSRGVCHLAQQTMIDITREALNNAVKHAQAQQVAIQISRQETDSVLTIRDDGVGFAPEAPNGSARGGHGLAIMAERAAAIGGSVRINSTPGAGTQVIARLPNTTLNSLLLLNCANTGCQYLEKCKYEYSAG